MSKDMLTIAEASGLIAAGKLSPVELTEACLARVETHDHAIHAFVTVTKERALADAKRAEAEIKASGPKSPLHGIPIGLKDIIDTKGILTACQSFHNLNNIPGSDATCAEALAKAGTVLMGKLTTHEFADGGPSFDNPWPPSRNPWNTAHFTAGSSSGTGAAIPAGMILGGLGTDTGGSIRGPAALCGIVGIKPTYGLVSRAGVAPAAYSLDHIGPMAWTTEDCALMLQALAGYDPKDPASANRPVPDYLASLKTGAKGLRIGVLRRWHEEDRKVAPAVQAGIDNAIKVYESLGAEIQEVNVSSLKHYAAAGFFISTAERAAAYEAMMLDSPEKFGARYRDRLIFGSFVTSMDYVQAMRRRRELLAEMSGILAGVDVVLTAGNPDEAPLIDKVPRWDNLDKPNFTMPFNLTGMPAICVPSGFGPQALPVSIQLAAKPFDEATLFRAAHAFEEATSFRDVRPVLAAVQAAA
ncbi:MAG: Asp-tRNA(Asn)/Glu-tRNA(Gln) amidotransferase GatCAB subunit A [Rhizobiales bacterium PAR1]|nr:MAG: Asp-tRNA(Asn)/Glu-tRNA(Gln) amidotransferase GatCAB subunit A [Rhizobiales bacterium PAR1]